MKKRPIVNQAKTRRAVGPGPNEIASTRNADHQQFYLPVELLLSFGQVILGGFPPPHERDESSEKIGLDLLSAYLLSLIHWSNGAFR